MLTLASSLVLLLLPPSARGGVPMAVPAGEEEAWSEPLSLAGLEPGPPGDGPWVVVEASSGAWRLRVRDEGGAVHVVLLAPAHTSAEREDIVWLAVSLLHPLAGTAPAVVEAPTHAPEPPPRHRRAARTAPPPEPAVPETPRLESVVSILPAALPPSWTSWFYWDAPFSTPPADLDAAEPPPPRRRTRWVEVDLGGTVRSSGVDTDPSDEDLRVDAVRVLAGADLHLGAGRSDLRGWDLGLAARIIGLPRIGLRLPDPGLESPAFSLAALDLGVSAWRPLRVGPVPLRPGAGLGLSVRAFVQAGSLDHWGFLPVASLHLGFPLRLSETLVVEPRLRLGADLVATRLQVGPERQGTLLPVSGHLGLAVRRERTTIVADFDHLDQAASRGGR